MLELTRTVVCEEIVIDNLEEKQYHYIPVIKELFIFDKSPVQTLKALLKKKNSHNLLISAEIYKHHEQHNRVFFFDATKYIDICKEIDRKKRAKLINTITNTSNECDILHNILYEHHIYMDIERMNEEESKMNENHLNLMNLLMKEYNINLNNEYDVEIWNNKSILDVYLSEDFTCTVERIFNRLQVDLLYPICVLFSAEKVFVKVFKNLKDYYNSHDFDNKIITRSDLGNYRNHIILYKLVKVDEVRKIAGPTGTQSDGGGGSELGIKSLSWALSKVVYIELAANNRIKVQFQLDENRQHFSGPTQLLDFLRLPTEQMIYMKEVQYTGSHKINAKYLVDKYGLKLRTIVNYFIDFVSLDHLTNYLFEVHNSAQVQYKDNEENDNFIFTLIMFFFKNELLYNKHIFGKEDDVIFLNSDQIDNTKSSISERKFNAVQKIRGGGGYNNARGSVKAKIIVTDEHIEFCFKQSFLKKQCDEFIFLFMRSLESILTREYFYIKEANDELFRMKIKDLCSISIPFYENRKMDQMTTKPIRSIEYFECDEKEISSQKETIFNEQDDQARCKSILKHFNYSRYCDKKRTPLFSFRKPDNINSDKIYRWPPLSYFNQETQQVFIKSVKYREPLQLKWNGEQDETKALFQLIIGDNKMYKCPNTKQWLCNLISVDFSFMYFYTSNDDNRFLSVTPLSPGWLPSLTKKDKSCINLKTTTNYIRKSSEHIDHRIAKFLLGLFFQEQQVEYQNATFITDHKKSLLEIIEERCDDISLLDNISNDTLTFFEIQSHDLHHRYSNIKYVYNSICYLLKSNIILIQLSDKKSDVPIFQNVIHPNNFQTVNYNRFSIVLETIDERNKSSSLSYHYQFVKLRLNETIIDAFDEALHKSFYDDLCSIYHNTICSQERMIDQSYYDFMTNKDLCENLLYQVVDEDGYVHYFVFCDRIISVFQSNNTKELICLNCPSRKHIDFTELDLLDNTEFLQQSPCYLLYKNIYVTQKKIGTMLYNVVFKTNNIVDTPKENHCELESISSELQYYDIEKENALYNLESYHRNDVINKKRMNYLFRKIKEHLIVNKNTTFEELLTLFVDFVDTQTNKKENKKVMIEKKYKTEFEYQLKWFIMREMREECFEMYNIFNYAFDFKKSKDTSIYEVGFNS